MTSPHDLPDHIDLNVERLARELRAAARRIDLVPGSELAVVTRGRRRQHRRRRATTFTLVTALVGGTAIGVQQLARTGDDSISSTQAAATLAFDESATTTPSTAAATAEAAPPIEQAKTAPEIPDDVPPAEVVDPTLAWTVVEPDTAEAVGWANAGAGPVAIPGVALATAPGRSDAFEPMLWRTDDGIAWEPVEVATPVGRPDQAYIDGSSIYVVGTAPGVAASDPNPMVVASSADGATWVETPLPIDTHLDGDLPYVAGISAYGSVVPLDDGVLAVVTRSVELDFEALGELDERLTYGVFEYRADGVAVLPGSECAPTVPTTAVAESVPSSFGALVPLDGPPFTTAPVGTTAPCDLVFVSWDDLGLPAETRDALAEPTVRAFRVVGGTATEVTLPDGAFPSGDIGGVPYFSDVAGNWYRVDTGTGGLVLADLPPEIMAFGWPIGTLDGVSFTNAQVGSVFGGQRDLIVTSGPDGSVEWTDHSALHAGDTAYAFSSAVTPAGLVRAVQVLPDPFASRGGVEESGGGLTVRRASLGDEPEFSLTASGEALDATAMRQDSTNGDLVAVDEDGVEIARMPAEQASPILYGGIDSRTPARWYVETTVDGRNVAVESIADLLGVDDADISSVPRISTDGTRTLVAVTMQERNADGVPRQLVLVGTPIGS